MILTNLTNTSNTTFVLVLGPEYYLSIYGVRLVAVCDRMPRYWLIWFLIVYLFECE